MSISWYVGIDVGSNVVSDLVGHLSRYSDVARSRLVSIGSWI
jgi:hypothetical protein